VTEDVVEFMGCASPDSSIGVKHLADSVSFSAPGKIILFGEHAVVYGRPAIAVPLGQVRATAALEPAPPGAGLTLVAVDLGQNIALAQAPDRDPLAAIARLTLAHLGAAHPDARLMIHSTIPIASGLGSGTAVSTAVVRALAAYLSVTLTPEEVSRLVYEVEKLHHGTPSGIDNTVIAYGMPVYFVRGQTIETFDVGGSLHLIIADTGVASPTRVAVSDVRRGWERDPTRFERMFSEIGEVVRQARALIEAGDNAARLGELMDRNHEVLSEMGVSSPDLERLVRAARAEGALGAKLSGAGRGGNMIALVAPESQTRISDALKRAGAVRIIGTVVRASAAA
jgi:mevalonate kinase